MTTPLTFDSATHTYWLGEPFLPSSRRLMGVHEVMKSVGFIDGEWWTEEGRIRGKNVALATHFDDEGALDEDHLEDEYRPFLDAWRKFKRESGCKVLEIEQPACDEVYGYAGTLDRVVSLNYRPCVVDIKLGAKDHFHPIQTAAYSRLWAKKYPGLGRCGVYLRPDGSYRLVQHTERTDLDVFLAACAVAAWKLQKGIGDVSDQQPCYQNS